jgi:hypothetical protein
LAGDAAGKAAHLFQPRDTIRYGRLHGFGHNPVEGNNFHFAGGFIPTYRYEIDEAGNPKITFIDAGNNPPDGVAISYTLAEKPTGDISLTVLGADGNDLRTFVPKREKPAPKEGEEPQPDDADSEEQPGPYLPTKAGLNTFVWGFRAADSIKIKTKGGDQAPVSGPIVPPGRYQVRLTLDGKSQTREFQVLPDPRNTASQADYQAQYDLLVKIGDKHTELNEAVNQIRAMREQIDGWVKRTKDADGGDKIAESGKALKAKLDTVESELLQVKAQGAQDTLNYPVKLNSKLMSLAGAVAGGDAAPAKQMLDLYDELAARIDEQLAALKAIVAKDVKAFNKTITDAKLPAVVG